MIVALDRRCPLIAIVLLIWNGKSILWAICRRYWSAWCLRLVLMALVGSLVPMVMIVSNEYSDC